MNKYETTLNYDDTLIWIIENWFKKGKINYVHMDGDRKEVNVHWRKPPSLTMCVYYNIRLLWNKVK